MMPSLKELQDQLAVLAAIQERQSKIQVLQAQELDGLREGLAIERATRQERMEEWNARIETRMREWDARIEKLVSGFGAFLANLENRS